MAKPISSGIRLTKTQITQLNEHQVRSIQGLIDQTKAKIITLNQILKTTATIKLKSKTNGKL